jgi:tetratricopeptide (TPR) repeat protein
MNGRRIILVLAACAAAATGPLRGDETADLWKDPEFQQRFLGTYGALGELEPRLTQEERLRLEKIIPLMSTDLKAAAQALAPLATPEASALFDFTLGNVHFQLDDLDAAVTAYQAAIVKFPGFLRAHKNLALVSVRLGRMAEAIGAFTRAINLGGGDALSFGLLGHAHSSQQDFLSAESAYRQAVLLEPRSIDWKLGLTRALYKQQKYAETAALCAELIPSYPARADLWVLQASAFVGLKEPMKAAQNYEALARMGKATVENMNVLGDIYVNESLTDLAARAYIQGIELDPAQDVTRPLRAAEILVSRGALDRSKEVLARIRTAFGERLGEDDLRRVLKLEARIAVAEGSDVDAVRVLEEVVALDPLDGEALLLLGHHHARSGETERAVFYYERAESLEKFEAEARVRHAQILVGQQRFQEALPLLRRAQELKPRDELARYLDQVERFARSQPATR